MLEGQNFALADRREQMERLFEAFERDDIEVAVDLLIERLDLGDGDLDLEPNGDELDGTMAEDDHGGQGRWLDGLGCPISDPGEPDDEDMGIEDDPAGCDPESDYGGEELGELTTAESVTPGCGTPTDDGADIRPIVDATAYRKHLARIRDERCVSTYRRYRDFRTGREVREQTGYMLCRDDEVPAARNIIRRKRGVPTSPRA